MMTTVVMVNVNRYWIHTMCQLLYKGSTCIINLFAPLQSVFCLIYRWEIWLGCNLHRKEKGPHTLSECPVSVSLPFYFTWSYMRTLPKVFFKILLVLLFLFPLLVNSFTSEVHRPGKLHHTVLNAVPLFFYLPYPAQQRCWPFHLKK